jgi:agmatine deiminase
MGLTMPFEGDQHRATWMCWPVGEDEWGGQLGCARAEYSRLVAAIAETEKVELLIADAECEQDARQRLGSLQNVALHRQSLDDCWFRDNGPTFVRGLDGSVRPVCWRFNAWGEKYPHARDALAALQQMIRLGIRPRFSQLVLEGGSLEVDGQGLLLTTRCCLLHPKRNPGRTEGQLEEELRQFLGVRQVLWLDNGLEGDHTDGHIDTLTRFVAPGRVVTSVCSADDSNHAGLEANRQRLLSYGLEVLDLPIPAQARYFQGVRQPESYANFYLCNQTVIVPQYGDVQDAPACAVLAQAFPERRLVALSARAIITGGGAFHCLTQQQPEGELCSWE